MQCPMHAQRNRPLLFSEAPLVWLHRVFRVAISGMAVLEALQEVDPPP